jgi:hypothetical protein
MDIETSSLNEDMIFKQKDLENKNNENRLDGSLFKLSWARKQTQQQDLPKDKTRMGLF